MKLYAINYDFNKPTPQQIYVGTNSEYKVGIKATRNGTPVEIAPSTATLNLIGTSTFISADASTYNGYVTFPMVTLDAEKFERYGLDVDGNEVQDFSLAVKVNKVDVGEIGGVGGGITSVSWTDIEDRPTDLGDFTNEAGYVTVSAMTSTLADYVTVSIMTSTLGDYVTASTMTSTLGDYVTVSIMTSTLSDYTTTSAVASTLSAYATTSAMESYVNAQIGAVLSSNF